jgi:DNA-binding NtrC family response regulator
LTPETLRRFEEYSWPGNVRELRNAVARVVALGAHEVGLGEELDEPMPSGTSTKESSRTLPDDWLTPLLGEPYPVAKRKALDVFERRYVEAALAAHGGNVTHAADASGLALRYFRLMKARSHGG